MSFDDDLVKILPRLNKFAHRLRREKDQAEDLLQDTVTRILSRRSLFASDGKPEAFRRWCFTIMYNVSVNIARYDYLRWNITYPYPVDEDGELADSMLMASCSDEHITAPVEFKDIAKLFGELPPEQQRTLYLIGVEGLRYEEAATLEEVPVGTVRSRLSRGRDALRDLRAERCT